MPAKTRFEVGVTTLTTQAIYNAKVARARVFAAHATQLGNSRLGIVLAITAVADVANPLIDELTMLYETTARHSSKANRSRLKQAAQNGLSDFLATTKNYAKGDPAFNDGSREGVFQSEMAGQSERLRASLALKLSSADPLPRPWTKVLKEDHPILYDVVLVGVGAGLITALAASLILKEFFPHSS